MDLSKLRKLSRTPGEAPDSTSIPSETSIPDATAPSRRSAVSSAPVQLEMFGVFELVAAIGVGLFFLMMGGDYARHAWGVSPFPPVTTDKVWVEGPKKGQDVLPEELEEPAKSQYQANVLARETQIFNVKSLFFLGIALIAAAVISAAAVVKNVPLAVRQGSMFAGIVVTLGGLVVALIACVGMLRGGMLPGITLLGSLIAILFLMVQVVAIRQLFGHVVVPAEPPVWAAADRSDSAGFPRQSSQTTPSASARGTPTRFVHDVLRKRVFADPANVVGLLQGPGARRWLADAWQQASLEANQPAFADLPDSLESEMTQVGPYSAVVLTLPTPRVAGEAFFAGVVLRSYTRQDGAVINRSPLVLYYCLEAARPPTADPTGAPADGVLCEWQGGDHVQFAGEQPAAFNAFRDAMWDRVQQRQTAEDQAGSFG